MIASRHDAGGPNGGGYSRGQSVVACPGTALAGKDGVIYKNSLAGAQHRHKREPSAEDTSSRRFAWHSSPPTAISCALRGCPVPIQPGLPLTESTANYPIGTAR